MTLSDRLRSERKKAGLSQVQFAEKLGLNARTYASYERGERDISTALLLDICKTLNISSDRLLGNPAELPEENKKPPATELREQLDSICETMPEEQQQELLRYARYLHDQSARKE